MTETGKMKSVEATFDSKAFKLITPIMGAAILGMGTMVWNKIEAMDEKFDQVRLIVERIDSVNNDQQRILLDHIPRIRDLERTDDRMFRTE